MSNDYKPTTKALATMQGYLPEGMDIPLHDAWVDTNVTMRELLAACELMEIAADMNQQVLSLHMNIAIIRARQALETLRERGGKP